MTAKTFTGSFVARVDWDYQATVEVGSGDPQYKRYLRVLEEFATSGSGNNQANSLYVARRTLSLSSPVDQLDLAGGLVDIYGNTLTLTKLKVLQIHNRGNVAGDNDDETATPTSGEDLLVGGSASGALAAFFNNDADAQFVVKSGGVFAVCDRLVGYTVTAGTGDLIQIEHVGSAGDISYDVVIVGVE